MLISFQTVDDQRPRLPRDHILAVRTAAIVPLQESWKDMYSWFSSREQWDCERSHSGQIRQLLQYGDENEVVFVVMDRRIVERICL